MFKNKKIITEYFNSWIEKDSKVIEDYFAENIIYIECYGPVYKGKNQCLKWFSDWNKKGSVLEWRIHNIYEYNNNFTVEWFFECNYDNNIDNFDGVSIIKFDNDKIIEIKEFQSKSQHQYPYDD